MFKKTKTKHKTGISICLLTIRNYFIRFPSRKVILGWKINTFVFFYLSTVRLVMMKLCSHNNGSVHRGKKDFELSFN